MYGRAYEAKKILRKKAKRPFAKEVVKEINSGEDLFAALYSRNIKELKQKAKTENRKQGNKKSGKNCRRPPVLSVVHEDVEDFVDSFDALFKGNCLPPANKFSIDRTSSSNEKPSNIERKSNSSSKKMNSLISDEDKENIRSNSSIPCDIYSPNDDGSGNIKSSTLANKSPDHLENGNHPASQRRRNFNSPAQSNKPNLHDSYIDLIEDSFNNFQRDEKEINSKKKGHHETVSDEYALLRLLPRSLSSCKNVCLKETSADSSSHQSHGVESDLSIKGEKYTSKLTLTSSTPAQQTKHAKRLTCQLSPILAHCYQKHEEEEEKYLEYEEDNIHNIPSLIAISHFKDLSLSSESDKNKPEEICDLCENNSGSTENMILSVDEVNKNNYEITSCRDHLCSPDPFEETKTISDTAAASVIFIKCGQSRNGKKEFIGSSYSKEASSILLKTNETANSSSSGVCVSSDVKTSFISAEIKRPTNDNKKTVDNLHDKRNTTTFNAVSKHCVYENHQNSSNPLTLSSIGCRKYDKGFRCLPHQDLYKFITSELEYDICETKSAYVENKTVDVDEVSKNCNERESCRGYLRSPDPFDEENTISDIPKVAAIYNKRIQSLGINEEHAVSSDTKETSSVLHKTNERAKLSFSVCESSGVITSSSKSENIMKPKNDSRKSSVSILHEILCDGNNTSLSAVSKHDLNTNNFFHQNSPNSSLSGAGCRKHDREFKCGLGHDLPQIYGRRNVLNSRSLKPPCASICNSIPRRSLMVVPLQSHVLNDCATSTGFREVYFGSTAQLQPITEDSSFIKNVDSLDSIKEIELTFKDIVLQRCGQTDVLGFTEAFPESRLADCKKIGEGVYGEVFSCQYSSNRCTVLKIMPIEGDCSINGEPQKTFEEILPEMVITMELSNLQSNENFNTINFPELIQCWCVKGVYPARLLKLWHEYDEEKTSENDCPEILPEDQIYIILELANVGSALESFTFSSAEQALSAFKQVTYALGVAETALEFEHRDLHWGNILIKRTKEKKIVCKMFGENQNIPSYGIQASVIDFTLSRMTYDGCCIYNNLAEDPALFEGRGDYQFDIYRMMRDHIKNKWQVFEPYNNVLWLSYVLEKLITEVDYVKKSSKVHKGGMTKLKQLREKILKFQSASEVAMSFS